MTSTKTLSEALPFVEMDRDASTRYEGKGPEEIVQDLLLNEVDPAVYMAQTVKARRAVAQCLADLERDGHEDLHPMKALAEAIKRTKRPAVPEMPALPDLLGSLDELIGHLERTEPEDEHGGE